LVTEQGGGQQVVAGSCTVSESGLKRCLNKSRKGKRARHENVRRKQLAAREERQRGTGPLQSKPKGGLFSHFTSFTELREFLLDNSFPAFLVSLWF